MSCMLLGVWLEAERKCFATVIGLDSLLFKNAVVFIKSVFYFVISHGRDRVLRENAAHASIPFCSSLRSRSRSALIFLYSVRDLKTF